VKIKLYNFKVKLDALEHDNWERQEKVISALSEIYVARVRR